MMVKIEVSTHSSGEDIVEVQEYNPIELAERINSNEVQAIVLGDNVYSRIDIKNIKVIEESE